MRRRLEAHLPPPRYSLKDISTSRRCQSVLLLAKDRWNLLLTDPETSEYQGSRTYSTGGDSYVVLEPDFIVDVTAIRSWVQCPRMYYLNKLSAIPLNYPVVKGTIIHEVFGGLLRSRDLDAAVTDRINSPANDNSELIEPVSR